MSTAEASGAVASWPACANAGVLEPGERHRETLCDRVAAGQASGPLVMDAAIAAIALEHGATLCTTDRDFARFPNLAWPHPIARDSPGASRRRNRL